MEGVKGRRGERGKKIPSTRALDFYGQMNFDRPKILTAYFIRCKERSYGV